MPKRKEPELDPKEQFKRTHLRGMVVDIELDDRSKSDGERSWADPRAITP